MCSAQRRGAQAGYAAVPHSCTNSRESFQVGRVLCWKFQHAKENLEKSSLLHAGALFLYCTVLTLFIRRCSPYRNCCTKLDKDGRCFTMYVQ